MDEGIYEWEGADLRRAGKIEKVYLIHQLDMSGRAGGILHVIGLAKGLTRQGIEVVVVAPKHGRTHGELPFPVRYLAVIPRPRALKVLTYELALATYLLQQQDIWTRKAAVYVRRGTLLLTPFLVAKVFRLISVVEENGVDWALELGKLIGIERWWHLCLRRIRGVAYRLAKSVIVPTEGLRQNIVNSFSAIAQKTFVVPNAVDLEVYHPRDSTEAREKLKLSLGNRFICYVGHFYPGRGLEVLIEAFLKVIKQIPDSRLLLVGDGPLRKGLEKEVRRLGMEEHILFTGFQPLTKAALYIAVSEICMAPFERRYLRVEVSPLKLYSYMACARPVVISDVPIECEGLAEAARLVPPEQPDALAEAIIDLLNHPEEARRMGERGRQIVEKLYIWDVAAKKVLVILNRTAESEFTNNGGKD